MRSLILLALLSICYLATAAEPAIKIVRVISGSEFKYRQGSQVSTCRVDNAAVPASGPVADAAKAFVEKWLASPGNLLVYGTDAAKGQEDGDRRFVSAALIAAGLAVPARNGKPEDAAAYAKLCALKVVPVDPSKPPTGAPAK